MVNMEAVDVIILTRNSERTLRQCLKSVYDNVPVNKLIIYDGYSADRTLDILREFQGKYGNVEVIQSHGTRGALRQEAISRVETEWFMFVDSDVVLSRRWFDKAARLVKDNVGAVWGMEIWSVLGKAGILGLFERVNFKVFEKRGGTHDLLVRRRAVEDISIPSYLHTYEDSYIKSWICGKNYEVIAAYEPYCIHYRLEDVWTIRQSVNIIACDLKFAIHYPQLMFSYAFYAAIVMYESLRIGLSKNSQSVDPV